MKNVQQHARWQRITNNSSHRIYRHQSNLFWIYFFLCRLEKKEKKERKMRWIIIMTTNLKFIALSSLFHFDSSKMSIIFISAILWPFSFHSNEFVCWRFVRRTKNERTITDIYVIRAFSIRRLVCGLGYLPGRAIDMVSL